MPVFVQVSSGAFGHQILDYEQILFNCQLLKMKVRPIFFQSHKSANLYFLQQMKKRHRVLPHAPVTYFHKVLCKFSRKYRGYSTLLSKANTSDLTQIHDFPMCPLALQIQSDHLEAARIVTRFSIDRGLVGFVIRDDGYDEINGMHLATDSNRHRNSAIDIFLPSINLILKTGRSIVRFGRHNHAIKNVGDSFYDFSDPNLKSLPESADFVLASKSEFFISTGSGPDCLAMFFRKPTYFVDTVFPTLPQTMVVKKFFIKHYFYTDEFGMIRRLGFDDLSKLFKCPEKVKLDLETGKLYVKSRSPAELKHFLVREVLNRKGLKESSSYSEVAPGFFY